jgi:signal transduction histidine kinase
VSTETPERHRAVNSSPIPPLPSGTAREASILAAACTPARLALLSSGAPAEPPTLDDGERFAAHVAHELRTPITVQRALVQVALADRHANTATLRAMGEEVLASCDELQRLIEALLDLTRSRRELMRHEPIDVAAIANQALQAHDPCDVETFVALQPAMTTGDPDLIERLAANLLSNAIRHNVTGGRIEIATRAEGEHAVLSVANTGRLIPADELPRLFRPFQQLSSQPRGRAHGVGLGLTIVQAIADAHNAIIAAHPRADGGLTIDISFPATIDTASARSSEQLRTTTGP